MKSSALVIAPSTTYTISLVFTGLANNLMDFGSFLVYFFILVM